SENLTRRLNAEIEPLLQRNGHQLVIPSDEKLTNPGMADLLAGLDSQCDVSVIFYLRPQLQWIPSAWKQWGLKTGASLSDFVAQMSGQPYTSLQRDIETWKSTLPAANIHLRFLISGIASRRKSCSGLFQSARPFTERVQVLKAKPEIPVSTSRSCTFCRKSLSFL